MALQLSQICDFCHKYRPVQHNCEFDKTVERAIEEHPELVLKEIAPIRKFETGATRDTAEGKLEFSEFFSVEVLEARAQYMHKHRIQPDGQLRDGGNWKKGIPRSAYLASLYRHFIDVWKECNGIKTEDGLEQAICAAMFNLEGMLYEILKEKK